MCEGRETVVLKSRIRSLHQCPWGSTEHTHAHPLTQAVSTLAIGAEAPLRIYKPQVLSSNDSWFQKPDMWVPRVPQKVMIPWDFILKKKYQSMQKYPLFVRYHVKTQFHALFSFRSG